MSRVLKFRAWDKLNKSFIYPDKGYQGHYVLTLDGRFQNLQNGSGGDEYVVQQFTGVKDFNNKDIYEGDIIQRSFSKVPNKVTLVCEWSNQEAAFVLKNPDSDDYVYLTDFVESLEVVSNIFKK